MTGPKPAGMGRALAEVGGGRKKAEGAVSLPQLLSTSPRDTPKDFCLPAATPRLPLLREGQVSSQPAPRRPAGVVSWPAPYLDVVLLFAVLVMRDGEAQGLTGAFDQHQGGTLGGQGETAVRPAAGSPPGPHSSRLSGEAGRVLFKGRAASTPTRGPAKSGAELENGTSPLGRREVGQEEVWPGYRDVALVDKVATPLLGDEQHFVEEEEGLLVAHTVHAERALQDELPVGGQVWPRPVEEQRLNLLQQRRPKPQGQAAGDPAGTTQEPPESRPGFHRDMLHQGLPPEKPVFKDTTPPLAFPLLSLFLPEHPCLPSLQLPAPEHLEPDRVLMPPLHVVDVPGHARHGVNGILHHLKAVLFLIKMLSDLL